VAATVHKFSVTAPLKGLTKAVALPLRGLKKGLGERLPVLDGRAIENYVLVPDAILAALHDSRTETPKPRQGSRLRLKSSPLDAASVVQEKELRRLS
jgi:hypothetical protein